MSDQSDFKGRSYRQTLKIDAPLDAVWKALTEGGELQRWFAPEARVEPGEGGKIWLSWRGSFEGEMRVAIWEPERHLRVGWLVPSEGVDPVMVDYRLEGHGGSTTLRLVHYGYSHDADWDDEFDSISSGWPFELFSLKHYLERHRGQDRLTVQMVRPGAATLGATTEALLGGDGLCREGTVRGLAAGERFRVVNGLGEVVEGTVALPADHRSFAAVLDRWDGALMRLGAELTDDGPICWIWLSHWQANPAQIAQFEETWRTLAQRLFPD